MPYKEAIFWIGITVLGTGLSLWLIKRDKHHRQRAGIVLIVIGAVGIAYSVIAHYLSKPSSVDASSQSQQTITVNGNNNNSGNVNQNGNNNNAAVGSNNTVGNTYKTYNIHNTPANVGRLVPANDQLPSTKCPTAPQLGDLTVFFGSAVGWMKPQSGQTSLTVLRIDGRELLRLDRDKVGRLALTGDVFNKNDDAVVVISKNRFTISDEAFVVDKSSSDLRVTVKHLNETVLQVRYLNKDAVRVSGHFYYHGKDVLAQDDKLVLPNNNIVSDMCSQNSGTIFSIN